jgi:hypothetical protein
VSEVLWTAFCGYHGLRCMRVDTTAMLARELAVQPRSRPQPQSHTNVRIYPLHMCTTSVYVHNIIIAFVRAYLQELTEALDAEKRVAEKEARRAAELEVALSSANARR